jgi:hypothetical protein
VNTAQAGPWQNGALMTLRALKWGVAIWGLGWLAVMFAYGPALLNNDRILLGLGIGAMAMGCLNLWLTRVILRPWSRWSVGMFLAAGCMPLATGMTLVGLALGANAGVVGTTGVAALLFGVVGHWLRTRSGPDAHPQTAPDVRS